MTSAPLRTTGLRGKQLCSAIPQTIASLTFPMPSLLLFPAFLLGLRQPVTSSEKASVDATTSDISACKPRGGSEFEQLFENPSAFNHKRVTITGIADSVGDNFWVWRDAAAYRHAEAKGAIFIVCNLPVTAVRSPSEYANAHWVKVTGIIDTSVHGHFGMDPFSLVTQRVEVLPGPRLQEFLPILGFFRNDTGQTIDIRAWQDSKAPYEYATHFPPGTITCFAIEKGIVRATSLSGKRLAEGHVNPG